MAAIRLLVTLFISLIQSNYSWDKALIFNPYNLDTYDVGYAKMTYRGGPYAIACPAKDKFERDFNKSFSLDNKSLFLRYYSEDQTDDIYLKRCTNSVELAVAYYNHPNTKRKYLKFGYEVYFDKSEYAESFDQYLSYSSFGKVSKSLKEIIRNFFSRSSVTPMLAKKGSKNLQEMGFMWVSKATLAFDKSNWKSDNLSYSIHKKIGRPATKCDNYTLLNQFYGRKSLDYFYTSDHQGEIFDKVRLPKDCESEDSCFMKYSLVPAYQFQTSTLVSCTNLTTVPVWTKITAPLLDHLDKFLFALAQVVDKKLTIYPKADDVLELPKTTLFDKSNQFLYLYPEKDKIPVPKIIFKVVVYQTHECDKTISVCWFQAIIVIHNETEITNKVCKEDKCRSWGWESIQYPDKNNPEEKSEHIYCCEMDFDLGITLTGSSSERFIRKDLYLNEFPKFNHDTREHEYENKLEQVKDKMNQLFGDGESSNPANSWPLVPPIDDVDFTYL